jgi:hypothetical protein
MLMNGWDVVADNNNSKSIMGTATYTVNDKLSMAMTGYGGPEQLDAAHDPTGTNFTAGANGNWRKGVDFWIDNKFTPKVEGVFQLDYGAESGADINGRSAEWFGLGGWLVYTFNDKWNVATRADYFRDPDGARTANSFGLTAGQGQELCSVTLTVNFKPVEGMKLAPELRWDHSSLNTAFDGHDTQVTVGMGAVYSY